MKEFLKEVENGKEFLCKDGKIIRSLDELAKIIKDLSAEIFLHHVNNNKNDFAEWVEHVIGDFVLANRIRRVKSKFVMSELIEKRILELYF